MIYWEEQIPLVRRAVSSRPLILVLVAVARPNVVGAFGIVVQARVIISRGEAVEVVAVQSDEPLSAPLAQDDTFFGAYSWRRISSI